MNHGNTPPLDAPPAMQELGAVVHLGAGLCSELESYLLLKPRRIELVEAEPELARALGKKTEGLELVEVRNLVLGSEDGIELFHTFNLPMASSLKAASGLKILFPGLIPNDARRVNVTGVASFVRGLELDAKESNFLIMELSGIELPAFEALFREGLLELFSEIYLCCGSTPLYEDGVTSEELLHWLNLRGFELLDRPEEEDPDRPKWRLRQNPFLAQLRAAEKELESARRALTTARAQAESLTQTGQEAQARIADTQKQLDETAQAKASAEQLAETQAAEIELMKLEIAQGVDVRSEIDKAHSQLEALSALIDAWTTTKTKKGRRKK